jgi:hypothetical protein
MKRVKLRKVEFDGYDFTVEASLLYGGEDFRGLSVGGQLSPTLAAKLTLLIEEEIGETVGAAPTSTGEPDNDDEIPF